jgi:hypothetical protein
MRPTGTHCAPFNVDLTAAQATQVRKIKNEVWETSALLLQILGHLHTNGFISQYGGECPASFSPGDVFCQVKCAKEAMVRPEAAVNKLCDSMCHTTDALRKGVADAPPSTPEEN